jgi:hypothetical protein
LKWKVIKRKLLLSKYRIVCRFPGPGHRDNHICGSWIHLLLMTLYVVLSSFFYCVSSLRYVLSNSWCNLCLFLPQISSPVFIVKYAPAQCCCPDT